MTLRVLDAGLHTRVVDFGRPASRSLGVPVGGAADRYSLALGNALVGNPPDAAALEITFAGPTLVADCDLACVLYGAPFDLASSTFEEWVVTYDNYRTPGKTFTLPAGQELKIAGTRLGMRAYFCVRGGLDFLPVLGSRSSLESLQAGAELGCTPGVIHSRFILPKLIWREDPWTLRVLPGTQMDWFPAETFFGWELAVTPQCNRMGLRLQGMPLPVPDRELVSEPVCPGSVQVTWDGQCIILGVDGQTIGGYPKIAQVISADLDKLAQLRPGDRIWWARVDLEEATRIYRRKQAELHAWVTRLRAAEMFTPKASSSMGK